MLPTKMSYSNDESTGVRGYKNSYWMTLNDKYDFVWTSATVIRKSVLEKSGVFKPGELIGQDLDLWSRIAQVNPVVAFSDKRSVDYNRAAENNARTRVKVAHPKAFLETLEQEISNPARTDLEREILIK